MKVVIYKRVSTQKQESAMQEHAIKDWLKANPKAEVVRVYEETISGKAKIRPTFDRMISDAGRGQFDTILVYRLDRFSRRAADAIKTILELTDMGVSLVPVAQGKFWEMISQPDFPFRHGIMALFADLAELEREIIVTRIKDGMAAAKANGRILGRRSKRTPEMTAKVLMLRKNGYKVTSIAKELEVSVGTISKIMKENRHVG